MSEGISSLPRNVLSGVLNGNERAVRAFEAEAQITADTAAQLASNVDATDAINDATVITLSPNNAFANERVLKRGPGISTNDDGQFLTIGVNNDVAGVDGGFMVRLTATQDTRLLLPVRGLLATADQPESLSNKTLVQPLLSNIGNYVDDAAAAVGGVPVGGVYHNAGVLRIRLA